MFAMNLPALLSALDSNRCLINLCGLWLPRAGGMCCQDSWGRRVRMQQRMATCRAARGAWGHTFLSSCTPRSSQGGKRMWETNRGKEEVRMAPTSRHSQEGEVGNIILGALRQRCSRTFFFLKGGCFSRKWPNKFSIPESFYVVSSSTFSSDSYTTNRCLLACIDPFCSCSLLKDF